MQRAFEKKMPVLVLDGHSRAAVETVQSLGRAGLEIDVTAESLDVLAIASRYAYRKLRQPPPSPAGEFQRWLRDLDRERGYELIVPTTEASLLVLRSFDADDRLRQRAVLPSDEALDSTLDKGRTLHLAQKLGVPVPQSALLSSIDELDKIGPVECFPLILKPVHSKVNVAGEVCTLAAIVARNTDQRRDFLRRWLPVTPILQQEYVRGHGAGVEFLFDRGRKVWHFAHERLHEFPLSGGASSYRRSINPAPHLLHDAERLLIALRWHGVAMVEFKVDPAGRYWLMEINPRLWGSLALSIDAGVDFPMGLLRLARGLENPAQPAYRRCYSRDIRTDAQWLTANLKASHHDPLLLTRPRVFAALELLRPLTGKESWDHFDRTDLKVTRRILLLTLRDQLQLLKRGLGKWQDSRKILKQHRALVARLAGQGIPQKIVFLCTGNVCRSPFAAKLAEKFLPQTEIMSAGFHNLDGRVCPDKMLRIGGSFGVDLSTHRSRSLRQEQLRDAGLVVAMDPQQLKELRDQFPEALPKATLLGLFAQPQVVSIPDPYLADEEAAMRVCQIVSSGIGGLVNSFQGKAKRHDPQRESLPSGAHRTR